MSALSLVCAGLVVTNVVTLAFLRRVLADVRDARNELEYVISGERPH